MMPPTAASANSTMEMIASIPSLSSQLVSLLGHGPKYRQTPCHASTRQAYSSQGSQASGQNPNPICSLA